MLTMLTIWQIWLIVAIVLLILELVSAGFYVICFSIGAFAAALVSAFVSNVYVQLTVFAAVSLLFVFLVRPIVVRHLDLKGKDERKSNADDLIGKTGTVSQSIPANGYGRVAIDGDDWKCQAADGNPIEQGSRVKVTHRESIILTVEAD